MGRPNLGIYASGYSAPGGGGGFTPTDLANLFVWYDAADTASITQSGGFASQINDKSGNGRHGVQATSGNQPATGSRTLNGHNVLDFDGGDSIAGTNIGAGVNRPYSGACVIIPDVTTGGRLVDGWTTTPNISIGSGNFLFNPGSGNITITTASTSPIILAWTSSSTNGAKTYFNNTAGGTGTSHTDGWAMYRLMVGQDGAFGESFLCSAEWSGTDLANVFSYLNAKWAVY